MEIVINKCYGGFGLSLLAEKEYLKRKGKKAFFYKQTKYNHRDGEEEYIRIDDINERSLFLNTFTKDLGKTINKIPNNNTYFYSGNIKRTDKDLIAVVKKLGEKANGDCAELSIIKIPDDIKYEISDYDGIETVHEEHKSW